MESTQQQKRMNDPRGPQLMDVQGSVLSGKSQPPKAISCVTPFRLMARGEIRIRVCNVLEMRKLQN